jgi:hypothetical protein
MQVKPFEVYVLCRNRSTVVGLEFLDAFVPSRKPVADEFLYPEFGADPQTFYHTPDEVMRRLEAEPQESYSIYWDGGDSGWPSSIAEQALMNGRNETGTRLGMKQVGMKQGRD